MILKLCLILAAVYAALRVLAVLRMEKPAINEDNPYLHPEKKNALPKDQRQFAGQIAPQPACSRIYDRVWKRALDAVLSFFALVLLSPLLVILMLAVFIDDPGPVLFTQTRVGRDKTYFRLHKFRSMKMSTPHDTPTHLLTNPEQYITRVGRFLRKSSLDEIPQVWDIFVGNMSIIGPRPALWNQDDLIAERDKYGANDVRPGLTGWAQINGRDELEIPVKAKLDGDYVRVLKQGGWKAFAIDCRCFLGTIFSVLRSDGVVEGGTGELHKQKETVRT